jgi:hypothetical protein
MADRRASFDNGDGAARVSSSSITQLAGRLSKTLSMSIRDTQLKITVEAPEPGAQGSSPKESGHATANVGGWLIAACGSTSAGVLSRVNRALGARQGGTGGEMAATDHSIYHHTADRRRAGPAPRAERGAAIRLLTPAS